MGATSPSSPTYDDTEKFTAATPGLKQAQRTTSQTRSGRPCHEMRRVSATLGGFHHTFSSGARQHIHHHIFYIPPRRNQASDTRTCVDWQPFHRTTLRKKLMECSYHLEIHLRQQWHRRGDEKTGEAKSRGEMARLYI